MSDREVSDFSMRREECEHCGAIWINGKHTWSTGIQKPGSELDLAGLVCNTPYTDASKCINPCRGRTGGDTWAKRMADLEKLESESENQD